MFTGIIEGVGEIRAIRSSGQGRHFTIDTDFSLEETKVGDSIAVNGACLTVVSKEARRFETDVSPETLAYTTFGKAAIGQRVNLERALRLSDRIDGHLVSGHIDGIGFIKKKAPLANAIIVTIQAPEALTRYMIRKGSVAVDGISLTINRCDRDGFEVSIIPHTASSTTIGVNKAGAAVNLETDMIGKYVERFVTERRADKGSDNHIADSSKYLDLLAKNGFL